MKEEIKKWFEKAEEDFDTAEYNLKGKKLEVCAFFLQQSAEKALKSLYIKKFSKLFKTHDLILLSKKVGAPGKIIEYCKELSPAYQYTRYPDLPVAKDLEKMIGKFLNNTREILKWVKEKI